jgi:flavin-dependent dehydrogenase
VRRTTALIVGGGPAGSAAAIRLARAGAGPLLIERQRIIGDALCGGFLSWQSLKSLRTLGVEAEDLNHERVTAVRLFARDRIVEASLPAPAIGVSRHRLDSLLLAKAESAGAAVERGVTVREIARRSVRTADGASIEADALFLASGKHDIRGAARPEDARGDDPTLGFRVRLPPHGTLAAVLTGRIELHLFHRGYAGIVLQEDGSANLCLAVHRSRLQAAGSPAALIAELGRESPALGERLGAAPLSAIDAIANVPYGWRARQGTPGIFRLGDQAGVIPSLAGEGMGIALASAAGATASYLAGGPDAAAVWQPRFAGRLRRPMALAGLVRYAAESRHAGALVALARAPFLLALIARLTRIGR